MKPVFVDSQALEKLAKEAFLFPPFLMMENAAAAMEAAVMKAVYQSDSAVNANDSAVNARPFKALVLCGSGNNGGDGYALARRLCGKSGIDCSVILLSQPKTEEAISQRKMAEAAGVQIFESLPPDEELSSFDVIVDCILGTGFKGDLREPVADIINKVNKLPAYKIACDIPTGLRFKADTTITMGCLKSILFSDAAKESCGKIIVADLGIAREKFESCGSPEIFLIEEKDIKLPLRKNKASHKGSFGHTGVFAGEKSGAGILAATAALNFGSGLVSLVRTENSNLSQFKISPELMISGQIPANASCVLIGSGLGRDSQQIENALSAFTAWFTTTKNPACVLDADLFSYQGVAELLEKLNAVNNAKILLTPHPKELKALYEKLFPDEQAQTVAQIAENRIEIGKKITERLPALTLIMKSANTFIAQEGQTYICDRGCQSLAKAGSGDVLAGMVAGLLAQGYTSLDAAITAVYAHASASASFSDGEGYDLTPEKLISKL